MNETWYDELKGAYNWGKTQQSEYTQDSALWLDWEYFILSVEDAILCLNKIDNHEVPK